MAGNSSKKPRGIYSIDDEAAPWLKKRLVFDSKVIESMLQNRLFMLLCVSKDNVWERWLLLFIFSRPYIYIYIPIIVTIIVIIISERMLVMDGKPC
jgi:hypothetical protein